MSHPQNPLSVKWRQIYADGFRIIYPTGMEREAQRMAKNIARFYAAAGADLKQVKNTIPIILQNQGSTANGFVQLAPKMSQFYTTPPQYFDSQDWLNSLAVHELRHVAQFSKISGTPSYPFPEEIYMAYIAAALPAWFLEGDAVLTETKLSAAGRGRQPDWIMPFRTELLTNRKFSYSKAYLGSEKDETPGFYQLGYLMTGMLKKSYGEESINRLFENIRKKPFRPYPFSAALKSITGKNTKQWYLQTIAQLAADWEIQQQQQYSETYAVLNDSATISTNYFLPQQTANGNIIALKQSKAKAPAIISIDKQKKEKTLFSIAYQERPWFSYANNLIVWDEIRFDPRYKQRSYSVICLYDLSSGKRRQLTFKSRLFSPVLSGNGEKLVAVQVGLDNQANLVQVDLQTGNIIQTYPNPGNAMLQSPALNADGSSMSWLSINGKGKSLWLMDEKQQNTVLIRNSRQQIDRPVFNGSQIAFNAHYNGINNIYEIDPQTKAIVALSASKYGAFNPCFLPGSGSMLFNDYRVNGYQLAEKSYAKLPVGENNFVFYGDEGDIADSGLYSDSLSFSATGMKEFKSEPYRFFPNLFNFHSLSPVIEPLDRPEIRLKSDNLLSTFHFYTGLAYENDLKSFEYNAGFELSALYPVISMGFKNRPKAGNYKVKEQVNHAEWRENYLNFSVGLPLSINVYQHNYLFYAGVETSYTQRGLAAADAPYLRHSLRFPVNYRFSFTHSIRAAERDPAVPFAQAFSLRYFHQPFDSSLKGRMLAFQSAFFFPGIQKNHVFSMHFGYQKNSGIWKGETEITPVFGYYHIKAKNELQNSLLLNYRFPIAFPDWELGPLAYIRNIRGGFFNNYENLFKDSNLLQPKTFGFELRSSMNLLRYQPVVDLGTRVIFVNKKYRQNPILAFIFNYSF